MYVMSWHRLHSVLSVPMCIQAGVCLSGRRKHRRKLLRGLDFSAHHGRTRQVEEPSHAPHLPPNQVILLQDATWFQSFKAQELDRGLAVGRQNKALDRNNLNRAS